MTRRIRQHVGMPEAVETIRYEDVLLFLRAYRRALEAAARDRTNLGDLLSQEAWANHLRPRLASCDGLPGSSSAITA